MQSRIRKAPKIYFSFRSPFSWLGVDRLLSVRPTVATDCAWIPFWDPSPATNEALLGGGGGFHYVQMSKAKHLYILQDAKRLSAQHGKDMQWPIDRDPLWEVPHLAWLAAPPHERLSVYDSIIEMRWGAGRNICDADLLAEQLGVDGHDRTLAQAYLRPQMQAEGVRCLTEAYNDDIFGIPYFKAGSHRYWGLERVDWFVAAYDEWRHTGVHRVVEPDSHLVAIGSPLDTDAPGGCG